MSRAGEKRRLRGKREEREKFRHPRVGPHDESSLPAPREWVPLDLSTFIIESIHLFIHATFVY